MIDIIVNTFTALADLLSTVLNTSSTTEATPE